MPQSLLHARVACASATEAQLCSTTSCDALVSQRALPPGSTPSGAFGGGCRQGFGAPAPNPLTPSIFQLSLAVKSLEDAPGGRYVRVQPFKLGLKIPIQTTSAYPERGQGYPVIEYEDTGLNTQMSVREGEPTLVGTLNTSRPGQLFVIVITVRRVRR